MIWIILAAVNVLALTFWRFSTRNPRNAEDEQQRAFALMATFLPLLAVDIGLGIAMIVARLIHGS